MNTSSEDHLKRDACVHYRLMTLPPHGRHRTTLSSFLEGLSFRSLCICILELAFFCMSLSRTRVSV
jgi:hypothetical protein